MQIPMIAPKESFDDEDDEDDFAASAGAAEALLVGEDVVDDELVVRVVEVVGVRAALVTMVVEGCWKPWSESVINQRRSVTKLTEDWTGVEAGDGDGDGVGVGSEDTAEEAAGLSAAELTGVVLSASFDGVELAGSSGAEVGAGEGVGESVVTGPAGLDVGAGVAGAGVAAIPC